MTEEFDLGKKIENSKEIPNERVIRLRNVKEFIKQTIKDVEKTFNYSRKKAGFLDRLRKRAGEKLK